MADCCDVSNPSNATINRRVIPETIRLLIVVYVCSNAVTVNTKTQNISSSQASDVTGESIAKKNVNLLLLGVSFDVKKNGMATLLLTRVIAIVLWGWEDGSTIVDG